jgi:hypothetical protein
MLFSWEYQQRCLFWGCAIRYVRRMWINLSEDQHRNKIDNNPVK